MLKLLSCFLIQFICAEKYSNSSVLLLKCASYSPTAIFTYSGKCGLYCITNCQFTQSWITYFLTSFFVDSSYSDRCGVIYVLVLRYPDYKTIEMNVVVRAAFTIMILKSQQHYFF